MTIIRLALMEVEGSFRWAPSLSDFLFSIEPTQNSVLWSAVRFQPKWCPLFCKILYIVPTFLQGVIFALVLRNNLMVF